MPWTREEKIFCITIYLEVKIIQNCLKINATHWYDNDYWEMKLKKKKKKKDCILWKPI